MPIDYRKLWILLLQKGITKPQFREMTDLSPATLTKLNKNQCVSMEVLIRVCKVLKCNVGDIVDVV